MFRLLIFSISCSANRTELTERKSGADHQRLIPHRICAHFSRVEEGLKPVLWSILRGKTQPGL